MPEPRPRRTTRISELEINSYLALDLKSKFHPCLESLQFSFEEGNLRATASLDLDNLSKNSTKTFARLIAKLFTGKHDLSVKGKLVAAAGKANFALEEARFDSSAMPNFLVEEIITAVGQKQKPPFDPLQPSKMPYAIDKAEVHPGFIVLYQ